MLDPLNVTLNGFPAVTSIRDVLTFIRFLIVYRTNSESVSTFKNTLFSDILFRIQHVRPTSRQIPTPRYLYLRNKYQQSDLIHYQLSAVREEFTEIVNLYRLDVPRRAMPQLKETLLTTLTHSHCEKQCDYLINTV